MSLELSIKILNYVAKNHNGFIKPYPKVNAIAAGVNCNTELAKQLLETLTKKGFLETDFKDGYFPSTMLATLLCSSFSQEDAEAQNLERLKRLLETPSHMKTVEQLQKNLCN